MEWIPEQWGMLAVQVAMGFSLAACAGLRAFLPLLVVGMAGRFDLVPLFSRFEWLESTPALIVFGVAVVVELLGDKFPVIDNLLDGAQLFIKPIAGTFVAAAVLTELSPLQTTILAIVMGGSVATGVHLVKAQTRLVSSATTAGLGNPILSLLEDVGALVLSVLSLIVPVVAALLLLVMGLLLVLAFRRLTRNPRGGLVTEPPGVAG